jgi:hypothetical protein
MWPKIGKRIEDEASWALFAQTVPIGEREILRNPGASLSGPTFASALLDWSVSALGND